MFRDNQYSSNCTGFSIKKLLMSALFSIGLFAASFADINAPITTGVPHAANEPSYVEVYVHRGDRAYLPENTIPAYRAGLILGTDWVDMDIGITKDGVIVVDHDLWLNPDIVSNSGKFWANSKQDFIKNIPNDKLDQYLQPYLVHNLTLSELQKYEVGFLNHNSPYAQYFPDQVAIPGTHIPTLQEVVDYVDQTSNRKVKYQIEIKNDPEHPRWTSSPQEFASKLYNFLKKNKMIYRVEIQSFDWGPLYYLQKLDPKIKTAYLLIGEEDKVRMLNKDPKIAGLWSGGKLLKDYNGSIPQMIKSLGGSCYEPEDVELTKHDLEEAHKLGLKVVVWTWPEHSGKAFNPVVVQKLIDWGVDGIITDDPARLNSMLAARYMHVPKQYINAK